VISTAALVADLVGYDPLDGRRSIDDALAGAAPGDVIAARDGDQAVAVVVLRDGTAYALDDRCPHDGGWLSDGWLDGDNLVCARHAWEIETCTGKCDRRPQDFVPVRRLVRSI
jgi:nitrite reductase/ring-hydroxylating ferredoxin subunit